MTGETDQVRDTGRSDAVIASTAAKKRDQDKESRVGKYGGDDGALEHEKTEIKPSQNTDSKVAPGRKPGA